MKAALTRLERIERIRAIAKQAAAREAAGAEAARAQLAALAARTRSLAADYARGDDATDGAALALAARFGSGLQHLCGATERDADRAEAMADEKLAILAQAEKRRAVIATRIATAKQRGTRGKHSSALTARRQRDESGTSLD